MIGKERETQAAPPKRTLTEIIAAIKLKEQQQAQEAQTAGELKDRSEVVDAQAGPVATALRRRVKRAANGTRRFTNVMIKMEPAMIQELDRVGAEMRLSRSELLRQAAQRVWLEGKGHKA